MGIQRELKNQLQNKFHKGKAIILIGPRQIGKTTLIHEILSEYKDVLILDGDDSVDRQLLENASTEELKTIIGQHKILFIDEVQRIEGIGLKAKIIVDKIKSVQLIMSGSSAFNIKNNTSESLTGRKWEFELFPISWRELEDSYGYANSLQQLETRLVYGMYPEIITHKGEETERLKLLVDSYLYKDMLAFHDIKKPDILEKLLTALALQLGSEVSFTEISRLLKVDKNTILNYVHILEKNFVIYTLPSFSKNVRNELGKAKKVFFWDNGVRNAIIGNYNQLALRQDTGALWENFLITERIKQNRYYYQYRKPHFWRTTTQLELDYVESEIEDIRAFEIKWNEHAKLKIPDSFVKAYQTDIQLITKNNFRDFIKYPIV